MASAKPVIHGPDHRPGGADPIPGVGDYIHYSGQGAFNTGVPSADENSGNYVVIEAAGPYVGSNWGAAIEIFASTDGGGNGGVYLADGGSGGVAIREYGSGELVLLAESSSGGIRLQAQGTTSIQLVADAGGNIELTTNDTGTQVFRSEDGFVFDSLHTGGGELAFAVKLKAGDAFVVTATDLSDMRLLLIADNTLAVRQPTGVAMTWYDHSGNAIFRVDEDGDLHGKTGKALTFDL